MAIDGTHLGESLTFAGSSPVPPGATDPRALILSLVGLDTKVSRWQRETDPDPSVRST